MELRDIEVILKNKRIYLYGNNLNMFRDTSQRSVILRIEEGKTYAIQSLFNYIKDLNFILLINGEPVLNSIELGMILKKNRLKKKIKQIDCPLVMGLNRTRVYKIEKGFGNSVSLLKYLTALNINLILEEKI